MRMVRTVRGKNDVRVQQEHRSAPVVELETVVERLVQRAVGGEVDAGPWTSAAAKHRDGGHVTPIARVAQLALKSGVDDLPERLAALPCQPLGRREELVRYGDRGADDA